MGFVDLHVHSNASDGTFSPSQVVELAKNAGLDAFCPYRPRHHCRCT